LGRFTLIVGANGSGKSTAAQAIPFVLRPRAYDFDQLTTAAKFQVDQSITVTINWLSDHARWRTTSGFRRTEKRVEHFGQDHRDQFGEIDRGSWQKAQAELEGFSLFSFNAEAIAKPVQTVPQAQLGTDGANLAAVLDAYFGLANGPML